jgi:hypothetical protein
MGKVEKAKSFLAMVPEKKLGEKGRDYLVTTRRRLSRSLVREFPAIDK